MTLRRVLVEISVTEQRYQAVLDVRSGSTVTDVAARFGVSRQAVHRWLARYEEQGLAGLADRSSRPRSSPAQTVPEVEALICELRRNHPRWGARRVLFELGRCGCPGPIPSRITVHRILVRHGLVDERPRRRRPNCGTGTGQLRTGHARRSGRGRTDHQRRRLLALAGRQHPVGFHLAGQRVTARLDHGVLHLLDQDRTVLRSLPNPLTAAETARIRDARPAGPPPALVDSPTRVDRRVSSPWQRRHRPAEDPDRHRSCRSDRHH